MSLFQEEKECVFEFCQKLTLIPGGIIMCIHVKLGLVDHQQGVFVSGENHMKLGIDREVNRILGELRL